MQGTNNVTGADNQQERLSVESIPIELGNFLSGFALGEASFMLVCRPRRDYSRRWKISAAFNVSQHDPTPLIVFKETLRCGTLRKAGHDGWYYEVNRLADIQTIIIPFFTRFPLLGTKAQDFTRFQHAVELLAHDVLSDTDYTTILSLREAMNNGGKRKYSKERILRDYTPNGLVNTRPAR